MFADQIAEGIAKARSIAVVDDIVRLAWRALAEGHLVDADAEGIAEAAEARRQALRSFASPATPRLASAPRRPPRSPDRQRSIERRRQLATCGAVPSRIAAQFTQGETAVLAVIGRQVKAHGRCDMPLDRIAALAGVSRTTVQSTLRQARQIGLIRITERRLTAWRNDTNLINIVSPDWTAWLGRGNASLKQGGRVQNSERHVIQRLENGFSIEEKRVGSRIAGPRHTVTGKNAACG
jgi:hypothetical protein